MNVFQDFPEKILLIFAMSVNNGAGLNRCQLLKDFAIFVTANFEKKKNMDWSLVLGQRTVAPDSLVRL